MSTEELLAERQKTHGDFAKNAFIAQTLRTVFREADFHKLTDVERESLDMIALKMSRILSGQSGYKEHWLDICGYAMLAATAGADDPIAPE